MNAMTAVNKDGKNGKFPNAALPITSFEQGQIWIEHPEGAHHLRIDDCTVAGEPLFTRGKTRRVIPLWQSLRPQRSSNAAPIRASCGAFQGLLR